MKWEDFRRSDNVEDRTGMSPGGGFGGGGMKLGGGALIVVVVVSLLFGVNPMTLLSGLQGGDSPAAPAQPQSGYGPQGGAPGSSATSPAPSQDPQKEFSARILGDTEDVWGAIFQAAGARYTPPKLVLFRGAVQSACGRATAAVGPFYCSQDREVYLDTAFFNELARRFKSPGDFAQAYVIAHEIGHHVQNLTGTMQKVDAQMERQDERGRNALSVRLELQADCYAGVWGYFAQKRNVLDVGDLEEGFTAASAIGDDQIQKQAQGYAVPETFTHGTSEQRLRWFKTGLESGDMRRCDTFAAR
jgi:predicted metalloprotease